MASDGYHYYMEKQQEEIKAKPRLDFDLGWLFLVLLVIFMLVLIL